LRQVPKEYTSALSSLQDQAVPCDFKAIKQVLVSNLGQDLSDIFLSFDENPIAAASIAQVHHALLKDRQEIAVKWLVSEFAKAISQELEWMASARDENSEPLPEEPNPLVNAPHVCFIRFSGESAAGALIGSIFGFDPTMFSFRFEVGEVRKASCGVVCSEVASCVSANTGKPQILQTKA
ncbi:ABC1 atypical kinase-like domain, partial [Dillenia turbinata]